jgi:hypothetical protein
VTCSCGQAIVPCTQGTPSGPCTVRCLHERPHLPSRRRPCTGWVHGDGWHLCDPSASHAKMASPREEEAHATGRVQ